MNSRTINWIGAGAATLHFAIVVVLLIAQGYAADENPGGDNSIVGTLWVPLIGLIVITAATVTAPTILARRNR